MVKKGGDELGNEAMSWSFHVFTFSFLFSSGKDRVMSGVASWIAFFMKLPKESLPKMVCKTTEAMVG